MYFSGITVPNNGSVSREAALAEFLCAAQTLQVAEKLMPEQGGCSGGWYIAVIHKQNPTWEREVIVCKDTATQHKASRAVRL